MAKIHGALWIVLGILILAYSYFIQARAEVSMTLFIWIGILFIVWGAFRLSQDYLLSKPKAQKREPVGPPARRGPTHPHPTGHPHAHPNQHAHAHHRVVHGRGEQTHQQGSPQQTHAHVKPHGLSQSHQHVRHHPLASHPAAQHAARRCPGCHHVIAQSAQFCHNCGMRFH